MPTASEITRLNKDPRSASARSFAYRFLAEALAFPRSEGWNWLGRIETRLALEEAMQVAWPSVEELLGLADTAAGHIASTGLQAARVDHLRLFGYTIRGACPPHEIEYGDNRADALFRPHRLANLAALYRAFGIELDEAAHERQDHLAIECEFASILAARSAHALATGFEEGIASCETAWLLFLREHIGRWVQAFASRAEAGRPAPWLLAIVRLLVGIVKSDCETLGIIPGSADIGLVSYEESEGDLCAEQCGLAGMPAGGAPPV